MMIAVTKKQFASGCKHFNGIQNDECRVGINYHKTFRPGELPCRPFGVDGQYHGSCSLFQYSTVEEIAEHEQRSYDAARAFLQAMVNNKCPTCGAEVVNKRQVGRCVYGDPCGHRLYQGKLNPSAESED